MDTRESDIPRLAWLVEHKAGLSPTVFHGSGVEVLADGFFEGCFAGPPSPSGLLKASHVFGSGMHLVEGRPVFIPASHTLECLFVFRNKGGDYSVSNSLPFLAEHCGLNIPYDYNIGRRFGSIMGGIQSYESLLFRVGNGDLLRLAYDNFSITERGDLRRFPKTDDLNFSNFCEYRSELLRVLRSAFDNAAAPGRRQPLTPIATCSSGYDSSAGAALAQSLGVAEALTLSAARDGQRDSGAPVAAALGLDIAEFDSDGVVKAGLALYEMFATGMGADDYATTLFEPKLANRVLLTGWYGDRIWGLNGPICSNLERGDISGCSLQEYRLRIGFTQLHVPIVAFRHMPKVVQISLSDEMAAYRMGGAYDRPIPRRLLEDAGVPRQAFGQSKKAAAILLLWDAEDIPAAARTALAAELKQAAPTAWLRLLYWVQCGKWQADVFAMRLIRKAWPALGKRKKFLDRWAAILTNRPLSGIAFLAGLKETRKLYSNKR